jgi:DNA polymerase-1
MSTAIIDADIVAFKATAAIQSHDIDWGDGAVTLSEDALHEALEAARSLVTQWREAAGCKDVLLAFTGSRGANFRYRVLPSYKANRVGKDKPRVYWETEAALKAEFPYYCIDGLEGDDVLGILGTTPKWTRKGVVLVSEDKDLKTIPGQHFNPGAGKDNFVRTVSPEEANHFWMTQTLTGDTTDGYKGLPKCGPVKAEKILSGCHTPHSRWMAVVAAYKSAGFTEGDALQQARVARILHRSDYDKTTQEILLWDPTTPERIPLIPAKAISSAGAGESTASSVSPAETTSA